MTADPTLLARAAVANGCSSLQLGWRIRPSAIGAEGQIAYGGDYYYPLGERDPRLAQDIAQFQEDHVGRGTGNGFVGPNTLRVLELTVQDWRRRGSPPSGEVGATVVERLILPGIEPTPAPQPELDCPPPAEGLPPFGPIDPRQAPSKGLSFSVALPLLVVAGIALWWLSERAPR